MSISTAMKSDYSSADVRKHHRRKMSAKNNSTVNGGSGESSAVRHQQQMSLAAAFHDHLSCAKKSSAEAIGTLSSALPPSSDHIYASCRGGGVEPLLLKNNNNRPTTVAGELSVENKRLRNLLFLQLELIKEMEDDIFVKDRRIRSYKQESDSLKAHLDRKERMCLLRRNLKQGDCSSHSEVKTEPNNNPSMTALTTTTTTTTHTAPPLANEQQQQHNKCVPSLNLVTRYFGRRSKTIPSRALKRRYLGPPKTLPSSKLGEGAKSVASTLSISSGSETQGTERVGPKPEGVPGKTGVRGAKTTPSLIDIRRVSRKRGPKRPKGTFSRKTDFLTTDKAYFLPYHRTPTTTSPTNSETLIDVPLWKLKPVTSFYQMEGTENLNDPVFQRRHLKCEQDERRRKRWDIQRLREQKVSEKLKYKYCRDAAKDSENNPRHKSQSFYPDPRHIQFVEVTDALPVLAFGHPIPLFQPSEFTISWHCNEGQDKEVASIPSPKVAKKTRLSSSGQRIT